MNAMPRDRLTLTEIARELAWAYQPQTPTPAEEARWAKPQPELELKSRRAVA